MRRRLTSEKAGADIFLYFFHSSPSEATMLWPNKDVTAYCSTGLGNRARDEVTSCEAYNHVLPKKLLTHFYGCRIGEVHCCTDIWIYGYLEILT